MDPDTTKSYQETFFLLSPSQAWTTCREKEWEKESQLQDQSLLLFTTVSFLEKLLMYISKIDP